MGFLVGWFIIIIVVVLSSFLLYLHTHTSFKIIEATALICGHDCSYISFSLGFMEK